MAKRARLHFMPIDYAYQERFGIMPDYDYTNRLKAGQPREEVDSLICGRMREIYEEQKQEYERQKNGEWQPAGSECPF